MGLRSNLAGSAVSHPLRNMRGVDEMPASAPHRGRISSSRRRGGEDGYILIGVIFLIVMVMLALTLAAPKVAADLERDRELELMHRGKQYQRAIQLYYRKFQKYPPNMEALEKTNEIRFLRRRYVDPITRKDEWHLIHYGEAKTPTMGPFGQPIAGANGTGSPLAGIGPGGNGQGLGSPIGGAGNSSVGGGLFNSNPGGGIGGGSQSGGLFGNSSSGTNLTNSGQTGSGGPTSPDPNAGVNGAQANGGNANGTPNTTDPNAQNGSTDSSNGGTTSGGSAVGSSSGSGNGLVLGGGGIIGVESTSPKKAILEYKKKTHFNEWEFVYDPMADMQTISSGGAVGSPIGGAGNSTTPGAFGNQGNGGIGNQNQNGIGGNPTPTPTPTPTPQPPQQ